MTVRLLGLADHLRAWGLVVEEVEGWESRGVDFPATPSVVVTHHTGTPRNTTKDYPSLGVVRDGRADLSGPLSQVGMGYSGTVYVIAAGKAQHAGAGEWAGVTSSSQTIGVEAESPGDGTWTAAQRHVYPLLVAALLDFLGQPAAMTAGHREWATPIGRKPDPRGIDLPAFRANVAAHLTTGPPQPAATPDQTEDDDMHLIVKDPAGPSQFVVSPLLDAKVHIKDGASLNALLASGRYVRVTLSARQLAAIPTRAA